MNKLKSIFTNPNKKMEEQLFNLKFTSKQFMKSANKCMSQNKQEKKNLKNALKQGNHDGAKIYAQNAIRQNVQYLNYLRLASRIDAVASKLDTALKMNLVTKEMSNVTNGMGVVLSSMDPEKITMVMELFEKQFEKLDIHSETVENAMSATTAMSTPQDEIDTLMKQVADEAGLELNINMKSPPTNNKTAIDDQDLNLESRLQKLRGEKT